MPRPTSPLRHTNPEHEKTDRQLILKRRPLGRSSLTVPELCFGASRIINASPPEATATVHAALSAGMDHVDTAPFYGLGESERRTGIGLADAPAPFTLSTKVGRLIRPGPDGALRSEFDYSIDGVHRSLEESLTRLKRDHIDMAILHDVSRRWHGANTDAVFDTAIAGAYRALLRWRDEGVVKAIGIGVNDCAICLRSLTEGDFDFLMLAGRTTLLDQEGFDAVLPAAQAAGVGVIAAAPFNSGILAVGARPGATYFSQPAPPEVLERMRRLEAICAGHGVALRAAALQLPLRHPAISAVLAGYASVTEVHDNLTLAQQPIPAAFWEALRGEGLLAQSVP